jgi:hypothetical protein
LGSSTDAIGVVTRLWYQAGLVGAPALEAMPHDGRRKLLDLSPAGRQAVIATMPFALAVEDNLLAPLSPAERNAFLALAGRAIADDAAGQLQSPS